MQDDKPEWSALSAEDFEVTGDIASIKDAGEYNVTITLKKYYKASVDLKLRINMKELFVDLNLPTEVESDKDITTIWSTDDAIFKGEVANDEGKGKIEGTLSVISSDENNMTVQIEGLKLASNSPFQPENYEPVYMNNGKNVSLDENGDATISDITIVNSDPGKAEDLKPGESGWSSTDGKNFYRVYDGKEHAITSISVNGENMTDGFTVDYNEADKVKDAGIYLATVTFKDNSYAPTTMVLTITKRPMHVWFNLPATVEKAGQLPAANYVKYEEATEGRGLIAAEGTPVASGDLSISLPIDGKCSVKLMNFALAKNEAGFLPSNYLVQVWDATQGKWIDYTEGTEVVIVDPNDPDNDGQNDEGNPNGDGGSGITVEDPDEPTDPDNPGTDPDDPNTDPDDPSTDPDDPNKPGEPSDPNKPGQGGGSTNNAYKHYQVIIEEECDGIDLSVSRGLVREGNQVSIYMEIAEGCDTMGMKLEYKRSLFGSWEDLKPHEGVQPGEYIIKNIRTDIYVRATGAKMNGSATGIEDVENTQIQVYAQDGNIRIFTPELVEVQIVNMAGVVVKNAEQTGWQSYAVDRGIYIVRVGEQVFKLKL